MNCFVVSLLALRYSHPLHPKVVSCCDGHSRVKLLGMVQTREELDFLAWCASTDGFFIHDALDLFAELGDSGRGVIAKRHCRLACVVDTARFVSGL